MFFGGDPFGGGEPRRREPVDNESYYNALGVARDATEAQIKKAYRKLALKHHPDRGGDPDKFKEISEAYETLADQEKRRLYDEYGKEGVENGGAPGGGAEDIFSAMFGGGGGRGRPRGPRQVEPKQHRLRVSLEDLYNGKTSRLKISRKRLCGSCNGTGAKREGAERTCGTCGGRGMVMRVRQMGPMIQQIRTACPECNGAGNMIAPQDRCDVCHGNKVVDASKVLEILVEKGMKNGEKIVARGEGNEEPGATAGDIIFIIEEREHDTFKHRGADLLVIRHISLAQALCGFSDTITHLDGRVLKFTLEAGRLLKDQQVMQIAGEGMPIRGNPYQKGNLFILFRVDIPDSLPIPVVDALREALGAPAEPQLDGEEEEVQWTAVDPESFGQTASRSARDNAYDDDDDDGPGAGGPVQCQQM